MPKVYDPEGVQLFSMFTLVNSKGHDIWEIRPRWRDAQRGKPRTTRILCSSIGAGGEDTLEYEEIPDTRQYGRTNASNARLDELRGRLELCESMAGEGYDPYGEPSDSDPPSMWDEFPDMYAANPVVISG